MRTIASLFGKLILLIAAMAFITGASLFVVGGYLATWPIMRASPRGRRVQAVSALALAVLALARAFAPDDPGESRPTPPKSAPL